MTSHKVATLSKYSKPFPDHVSHGGVTKNRTEVKKASRERKKASRERRKAISERKKAKRDGRKDARKFHEFIAPKPKTKKTAAFDALHKAKARAKLVNDLLEMPHRGGLTASAAQQLNLYTSLKVPDHKKRSRESLEPLALQVLMKIELWEHKKEIADLARRGAPWAPTRGEEDDNDEHGEGMDEKSEEIKGEYDVYFTD